MGRKKVVLKRIEDNSSRHVTFSKRRPGLIKKARELSILCDAEIAIIVFSRRGRLYEFSSSSSVANIIRRYCNNTKRENEANIKLNDEEIYSEQGVGSLIEQLQLGDRNVEGPDPEQLSTPDLVQLERELVCALTQTRVRKLQVLMELIKELQEKQQAEVTEAYEKLKNELDALIKVQDTGPDRCHEVHNPAATKPTLNLFR